MIRTTKIWVRIDPFYWYDWDYQCRGVRFGKVRRTRPPREEAANYVEVVVAVDDDRFKLAGTA